MIVYDDSAFRRRFGFGPEFLPDYKSLVGDASDNIPGVPGIGPKSAQKLISQFGRLEAIYRAIESDKTHGFVSQSAQDKLMEFKEQALFAKRLTTIRRDAPVTLPKRLKPLPQELTQEAKDLFSRWGFKALLSRFERQGELNFSKNSEKLAS